MEGCLGEITSSKALPRLPVTTEVVEPFSACKIATNLSIGDAAGKQLPLNAKRKVLYKASCSLSLTLLWEVDHFSFGSSCTPEPSEVRREKLPQQSDETL
jgi:hypothetical protein